MKILIVEDNANKRKQIEQFLRDRYECCEFDEAYSFSSGTYKALKNSSDLLILDMSLPTYDITHSESGGDKKPIAGKNIMKRMLNRKVFTPTVVITQFETFDDDRISLESLNLEFQEDFTDIWKGTIYYGDDDWQEKLDELLAKIGL